MSQQKVTIKYDKTTTNAKVKNWARNVELITEHFRTYCPLV
jgi:hypothetical protein